jgi:hypothetical protein
MQTRPHTDLHGPTLTFADGVGVGAPGHLECAGLAIWATASTVALCPVLCPPPIPTECDRVSLHRWKALSDVAFVAFRHLR